MLNDGLICCSPLAWSQHLRLKTHLIVKAVRLRKKKMGLRFPIITWNYVILLHRIWLANLSQD